MLYVFTICAVAGGTVLLVQFALMLLGLGGDWVGDTLSDLPDDIGHGDFPTDAHVDGSGSDIPSHSHEAAWFLSILSFKSMVAAATFFGLAGLAANAAEMRPISQWIIALVAGAGAMYGVAWTMRAIGRLTSDGTIRIQRTIGHSATVYVPIAPNRERAGKVHVRLHDRLVEYEAVTDSDDRLTTGMRVRVVGVAGNRLEVEPLGEPVAS